MTPDDAETQERHTGHTGGDDGHHQRRLAQAEERGQLLLRAGRRLQAWVEVIRLDEIKQYGYEINSSPNIRSEMAAGIFAMELSF